MKNLDELILLFPQMEQKRQESTLGGDIYDGGDHGVYNGGTYDPGVTIYAPPITPPPPYSGPGFNPGDNQSGGGSNSGDGGSGNPSDPYNGQSPLTPLHPEIVNDLLSRYKFAGNLSPTQKDNFKEILGNIDSTKTGDKMLSAIDAYYQSHPNITAPTITDKVPPKGGSYAFDSANNEFDFSNLLDGGYTNTYGIYNAGHEIYHSLEWANINIGLTPNLNPNKVNFELDAYLIAAEMAKEAPYDLTTSNVEHLIQSKVDFDSQNAQQVQFTVAWNNFINGDYSASNYWNLVNGFQGGSDVGSNYLKYNGAPVTTDPNTLPQWLKDLQTQ
ncbi:hypothetical protein [Mucilaginibacter lappiensis]|uniref:Uncharacterized protein n=1 Tax=Mucilaginibacter lappiensis TaxID=354630 RepID=A0A841JHD6_9SPHI|nr:hypothetical protein [Mucilaginibacter lappiensis]MBB6130583.1 hypothetical protein [Mucilaginibacter lappiensis]